MQLQPRILHSFDRLKSTSAFVTDALYHPPTPNTDMASINPDSGRNLATARVLGERGFPAEGQAKHSLSVQERARKRKWNISGDEHRLFEGGDVTTR